MPDGKTIPECVALTETGPLRFQSKNKVGYNGHLDKRIGYGGWTVACGINAAAATAPKDYNVYSVTGYFLGPSWTTSTMTAAVQPVRDTRTFATRQVDLLQVQPDGSTRKVMFMVVDFHKPEPASLLTYSAPPTKTYSPPEQCITFEDKCRGILEHTGSEKVVENFKRRFQERFHFFETLSAPEGMMAQTFEGMVEHKPVQLDSEDMHRKTTYEYFRSHHPIKGHLDNVLSVAWIQDGGMPYIPPSLARKKSQIGAAGSLEFALRVFSNELDLTQWVSRKESTMVGADGRTYVEAKMWDRQGRMIASMTEQCMLRPRKARM